LEAITVEMISDLEKRSLAVRGIIDQAKGKLSELEKQQAEAEHRLNVLGVTLEEAESVLESLHTEIEENYKIANSLLEEVENATR